MDPSRHRTVIDRLLAIVAAAAVGLFAAILDLGATQEGGLFIFGAIASTYGVLAIVQDEFRLVPRWKPSWTEGGTMTWVGGWVLMVVSAEVRALLFYGPAEGRRWLGWDVALLAVFIVLPWGLSSRRRRSSDRGDRALPDP